VARLGPPRQALLGELSFEPSTAPAADDLAPALKWQLVSLQNSTVHTGRNLTNKPNQLPLLSTFDLLSQFSLSLTPRVTTPNLHLRCLSLLQYCTAIVNT
jgi:hypothetical protein